MSRRFTCTDKWEDVWFSGLDLDMKLAWMYILDRCDHAGIWKRNFKNLCFHCNSTKTPEEITTIFKDRIMEINNDKWFIPKFLKFQYPKGLNSNKPALIGVRSRLIEEKLLTIVNELFGNDYLMINQSLDNDKTMINQSLKTKTKTKIKIKTIDMDKDMDMDMDINTKKKLSAIQELWNAICLDLPKVKENSKGRETKEVLRLKERSLENWKTVFETINNSDFCKGQNDQGWQASYDWILSNDTNAAKVLEGKYANRNKPKTKSEENIERMRKGGLIT